MRLVTYAAEGAARAGVIAGDGTVVAAGDLVKGAPDDALGVIAAGERTWRALADAAQSAKGGTAVGQAKLLAPIPRPKRNVFCVGWNYREHFAEGTSARGANEPKELPQHPSFFSKNPNTVVGPDAGVRSEEHTSELQSPYDLVCRLLLEKKKKKIVIYEKVHYEQVILHVDVSESKSQRVST